MRPELPYLGAGAAALIGGYRTEGGFPENGYKVIIATVVLLAITALTSGTRIAPLVRAIGLVMFMAAVYGAARAYSDN